MSAPIRPKRGTCPFSTATRTPIPQRFPTGFVAYGDRTTTSVTGPRRAQTLPMPGGLGFQGLRSRGARIELGDVVVVVASLEDVIASNEAAGRPKALDQPRILRD